MAHQRGRNGKPKGYTRHHNGTLEQRENLIDAWRAAITHDSVRKQLIEAADTLGAYVHDRERGIDELDITSFVLGDQQWGYERHQRPPVLFQIHKDNNVVHAKPQAPMMLNGLVLLDQDDHAILDWSELPATISSQVTGQEIEYFRRSNDKIDYFDIIARMPRECTSANGKDRRPSPSANTLNMRSMRFRLKAGCISWKPREGSDLLKTYIHNLLGQQCVQLNSSMPFGRDLTKQEIDAALLAGKGTQPKRRRKYIRQSQEGETAQGDAAQGEERSDDEESSSGGEADNQSGDTEMVDESSGKDVFHTTTSPDTISLSSSSSSASSSTPSEEEDEALDTLRQDMKDMSSRIARSQARATASKYGSTPRDDNNARNSHEENTVLATAAVAALAAAGSASTTSISTTSTSLLPDSSDITPSGGAAALSESKNKGFPITSKPKTAPSAATHFPDMTPGGGAVDFNLGTNNTFAIPSKVKTAPSASAASAGKKPQGITKSKSKSKSMHKTKQKTSRSSSSKQWRAERLSSPSSSSSSTSASTSGSGSNANAPNADVLETDKNAPNDNFLERADQLMQQLEHVIRRGMTQEEVQAWLQNPEPGRIERLARLERAGLIKTL